MKKGLSFYTPAIIYILTFHSTSYHIKNKYNISPIKLKKIIEEALKNKYEFIDYRDLCCLQKDKKYIMLTFDDGKISNFKYARKILKEYHVKGTFFIFLGGVLSNLKSYMKWRHLRKLIKEGFCIGSHGFFHSFLTKISNRELYRELVLSKKLLEAKLNINISGLAFPFGIYNQDIIDKSIEAGYKYLFTTNPYPNLYTEDKILYHRYIIYKNTPIATIKKILKTKPLQGIPIPSDGEVINSPKKHNLILFLTNPPKNITKIIALINRKTIYPTYNSTEKYITIKSWYLKKGFNYIILKVIDKNKNLYQKSWIFFHTFRKIKKEKKYEDRNKRYSI